MRVNERPAPAATTSPVLSRPAERLTRYAQVVFAIICVVSALTLVVAVVLRLVAPHLVTWVVWVRAGFYTVGAAWLLHLVRSARRTPRRSSFTRLRVVSVLAPLGIAALVISPDSGYPVWMKVEQAALGLLLVPLAVGLFWPSVAADFPKTARQGRKPR